MSPEDLLDFIQSSAFERQWARLGLNDEEDLFALEMFIMTDPKRAPVVEGTGGLRKVRFAPDRWNTGSSGGARVCYVYFEEFGIVYWIYVYRKSQQETLSANEKKAIKAMIERIEKNLRRRQNLT
jgi:hypothetical protein